MLKQNHISLCGGIDRVPNHPPPHGRRRDSGASWRCARPELGGRSKGERLLARDGAQDPSVGEGRHRRGAARLAARQGAHAGDEGAGRGASADPLGARGAPAGPL